VEVGSSADLGAALFACGGHLVELAARALRMPCTLGGKQVLFWAAGKSLLRPDLSVSDYLLGEAAELYLVLLPPDRADALDPKAPPLPAGLEMAALPRSPAELGLERLPPLPDALKRTLGAGWTFAGWTQRGHVDIRRVPLPKRTLTLPMARVCPRTVRMLGSHVDTFCRGSRSYRKETERAHTCM
jgi:hypothetical protein